MRRIDLDKLILEAYQEVLSEQDINTIFLKDLPQETVDAIKKKYGEVDLENDFVSNDFDTYYKFIGTNPGGGAKHKVIQLPSFIKMYVDLKDIVESIKDLSKNKELVGDKKAKELFELLKSNFRKLQSYLRTERPDQHHILKVQGHITSVNEQYKELKEHLSSLNEALSEEDYHRLIELINSANSHLPIYYSPSWNVVNIGGTGYDRGDLVKHFNAKPGTSSTIKNLFYHAAKTPEETKEAVERLSNGKISVELDRSLVKYKLNSLNESLWKEISEAEEEPTPEEEPDMTAPKETVLEDATDKILGRFPTVKAALVKLHTEEFKEFVDSIDWISPRPSSFRINLKNGQDYELKWMGKSFQANILGKRFFLNKIDEYQQALDKLNVLYKEAPFASADEEAELADVDTDTGGGGGGGGDFPGAEPTGGGGEEDLGGEEEGGADLSGEPVDFEAPAEEPEA